MFECFFNKRKIKTFESFLKLESLPNALDGSYRVLKAFVCACMRKVLHSFSLRNLYKLIHKTFRFTIKVCLGNKIPIQKLQV